jgi:hypothetical protein
MARCLAALALVLAASGAPGLAGPATVIPHPRVAGDAASPDFAVRVDGTPIDTVSTGLGTAYAHFAFSGTVRVEIDAREPIRTFNLSPHRDAIPARADGRTLVLELTRPRALHLRVNALPRLFLFSDAVETDAPRPGQEGVRSLADYGLASVPDAVRTAEIQAAIDDTAARKGTLVVPPGVWRSGQLRLRSDMTLYLAPGAVLRGTGRLEDYPPGELGTQFLDLTDCRNVRIHGRGVVDGRGASLRLAGKNVSASRMKLVRTLRVSDCAIEGIVLRDAGTWGVHLVQSDGIRLVDVKLISNTPSEDPAFPWEPNTDGIDPDNSSRVLVEGCFVSCGDDAFAVKLRHGARRDVSDIRIRGNVVFTTKSALKIGSEIAEKTLSDVAFEDNDIVHADRGIVVYCDDGGAVERCRFTGNRFETIGGDLKRMHIEIRVRDGGGAGRIADLRIEDCAFEREAENPSRIRGLDAGHAVVGITIANLVVAGRRRTSPADARILVGDFVTGLVIR